MAVRAGDWRGSKCCSVMGQISVASVPRATLPNTKAGRWNKVKSLQRLLTHAYSGKVLAVRRVTENTGKKTPGVDQVIWKTPEDKIRAVHALKSRGYQSQPLRRVYIPKSDGKTMRPLGIPC